VTTRVEPGFQPIGAGLHVTNGVQIFIELCPVVAAQLAAQGFRVIEDRVEHAVVRFEPLALRLYSSGVFAEQAIEHRARVLLRGQRRSIAREGQCGRVIRLADAGGDGQFERGKPRMRRCDLRHELIAGDGIAHAPLVGVELGAREKQIGADMLRADAVWVMQSAEDGEVFPMPGQRFERFRELVVPSRLRDLPRHAVHAIRDVSEDTPARLVRDRGSGGPQRSHRIEQGESDRGADAPEKVAAADDPALGEDIAHRWRRLAGLEKVVRDESLDQRGQAIVIRLALRDHALKIGAI